nr:immunoglobulin heavy chain junction region [Macaca mulatta]MOV49413.1 immunoglobulin heavy chain junction region [Macaca mulatta]MOV49488.1 immunoglobulin heavy chain junction region [Macaca mulatta]MOV50189.1 immunoglobulin heavy chain junction region [Macaca mulatta]MOV50248.1 immunoglobulin heavy chain junction region [Macaca mulatta]
CTRKQANFDYW